MDADTAEHGQEPEPTITALIAYYARIDAATAALPFASVMPYLRLMLAALKLTLAIYGDILLIIPINIVVLFRNIFPGRWNYKCFSCRYLRVFVRWIWSGECQVATVPVRPLAVFFLHTHFRRRLAVIRRAVILRSGISNHGSAATLAEIDRATDFWSRSSVGSIVAVWVLPMIGPAIEIIKLLKPIILPPWSKSVAVLLIPYVLVIPVSAFVLKRGLMLGACGQAAYFPGSVEGAGCYAEEKRLMRTLGIATSEFPLDVALAYVGAVVGVMSYGANNTLSNYIDYQHVLNQTFSVMGTTLSMGVLSATAGGFLVAILASIAWARRSKLGRA